MIVFRREVLFMDIKKYVVINDTWYCVYEKSGIDEFGYFVEREYREWK